MIEGLKSRCLVRLAVFSNYFFPKKIIFGAKFPYFPYFLLNILLQVEFQGTGGGRHQAGGEVATSVGSTVLYHVTT